jgi:hypothetical protein
VDYESVDIWIDSSCNGYETDVGAIGLKYGRNPDGTVIGNGDDPCVGHENRLYARVHNGGNGPADDVRVQILIPKQREIYIGGWEWIEAGVATAAEFPDLLSMPRDTATEVYVSWTFEDGIGDYQLPENYIYPTAVRVYIEPVENEPAFLHDNQDAQEVFGNFDLRDDGDPTTGWVFYDPFFWIKNPFSEQVNPLPFYINLQTELPLGVNVGLPADIRNPVYLDPGQSIKISLVIQGATFPTPEGQLRSSSAVSAIGESFHIKVSASTEVNLENPAAPQSSPYAVSRDSMVIGTVAIAGHIVLDTQLPLSADLDNAGNISIFGRLEPAAGEVYISVDFTDPSNNTTTHLIKTNEDGSFSDTLAPTETGTWLLGAIWQGNREYANAVSEPVWLEVNELPKPAVPVDIKPGICPNRITLKDHHHDKARHRYRDAHINHHSTSSLSVAIAGTEKLNVSHINPKSIRLEGVRPSSWRKHDVATPYEPYLGKSNVTDCTDQGPDGYTDLAMRFSLPDVIQALGEIETGKTMVLSLSGKFKDQYGGASFRGEDVLIFVIHDDRQRKTQHKSAGKR